MEEREIRALQAKIARLEARLAEVEDRPTARLHRLLVRLGASRRGRFSLGVFVALAAAVSYAAQISVPNTFTNGTPADASQVNANFSTLETESNAQDLRLAAVEAANFQSQIDGLSSALDSLLASGIALQNAVATNTTDIATNQAGIATNATGIGALETTFAGVSRAGDLLTFSGMNVQVVGGSGQTAGVNGLGNLIVGYNENNVAATRTGSHNLVVGYDHEYTSSGSAGGCRTRLADSTPSSAGARATRPPPITPALAGARATRPPPITPALAGARATRPPPITPASAEGMAAQPTGPMIGWPGAQLSPAICSPSPG
jgi:hypothetical protein